ncbi:HAD family hydrolase [Methanolobus psychrotolerans]|uniref:HAD family hydrolase n=1 Tax=Methanolobus psychrotolerans TaxID=1874706 RepID=UPI001F5DDB6E|nr:HAD family hydrolase [Methanolobus psychrotolerans]
MQKTDGTEDRKIKGIMFDMDNTLFDLVEAKTASCNAIVDHIGTGDPEELLMYFLRSEHGFESPENIRDYLKDIKVYNEFAFENCCKIYHDTKIDTIKLYPHVLETLALLRERRIGLFIVTDASHANARARLEKLSLSEMFDHIITSDMTGSSKPDIKVFHHALSRTGLRAEEVLFVGDSLRRDIEPAKKAGMMTAHALYGDRNIHELCKAEADHILNNIRDIFNVKGIGQQ